MKHFKKMPRSQQKSKYGRQVLERCVLLLFVVASFDGQIVGATPGSGTQQPSGGARSPARGQPPGNGTPGYGNPQNGDWQTYGAGNGNRSPVNVGDYPPEYQEGVGIADSEDRLQQQWEQRAPNVKLGGSDYDSKSADCQYSKLVDSGAHNYCGTTKTIVTAAEVTTAVGTVAGQVMATTAGSQVQNQASNPNAKMSETYQNTANMAKSLGNQQIGLGAAEVIVGVAAGYQASKHKKSEQRMDALKNQIGPNSPVSESEVKTASLKSKPWLQTTSKESHDFLKSRAQLEIATTSQEEQAKMRAAAKNAAAAALVSGATHIAQGIANKMTAKEAEAAANEMRNVEDNLPEPTNPTWPSFDPTGQNPTFPSGTPSGWVPPGVNASNADPFPVANNPSLLTMGSATTEAPGTESNDEDNKRTDLGAPIDTAGTGGNSGGGGPGSVGPISPSKGGAGGGPGGGGGFFPGGSTGAARDEAGGDTSPRLASNQGAEKFESGGAAVGGTLGGGKPDEGPDLSGLLNLLKGKDEKKDEGGKNILEFGSRGLAGAGEGADGQPSLLDKSVNLFERVHLTYQEKHRRGVVQGRDSGG